MASPSLHLGGRYVGPVHLACNSGSLVRLAEWKRQTHFSLHAKEKVGRTLKRLESVCEKVGVFTPVEMERGAPT
jgi:hypothetical protein